MATLAACGTTAAVPVGPEYLGVCVNQVTGFRADDALCNGGLGGTYVEDWVDTYRYPNFIMPAYGSRINITHVTVVHTLPRGVSSSRSVPRLGGAATSIRTGLSSSGSTIQRGGFGLPGSAGASGGGSISRVSAGS